MPASTGSLCSCDGCKTGLDFPKESGFVEHRFLKLWVLHNGPFQVQVLPVFLACFRGILVISPCSVNVLGMQIWVERPSLRLTLALILLTHGTSHAVLWVFFQRNSRHIAKSCMALEPEALPRPLDVAVPH